jgi:diguanylate cyclase
VVSHYIVVEVASEKEDRTGARWKSRYLGVLDAQERLEKDAGLRIAELSALVARLGRAVPEGRAASLARRLEKLGDALKRRPLDPKLSLDVDTVHQSVLTVMADNEREHEALTAALETAVGRLESAATTGALRRQLKRFRASVGRSKQGSAASELISGFGKLQDEVLNHLADASPAEGREHARDTREDPPARPPPVPPAPRTAPAPRGAVKSPDPVECEVVRAALSDLVAGVELPGALQQQLRDVVADLDGDFGAARLMQALARIRDIFEAAFSAMRDEFRGFLDSVDRRLDVVLLALAQMLEGAQAARSLEHELAEELKSGLAAMRSEAADAGDLDQLKTSIDSHLDRLVRSVSDFRDRGDALSQSRDEQLESMTQRLRELEGESRVARGQLEAQRQLARTDELTGLANRRALEERMEQEVQIWRRHGTPLTVAIADLDHFKRINDRFGHPAGDRALSIFADIVTRRIRHTDFCARYGGEEFVLVFPGTRAATAAAVVEQVRGFVESCGFSYRGTPAPITASFGVTEAMPGDDAQSVLARADKALYAAKNGGRNRVHTI